MSVTAWVAKESLARVVFYNAEHVQISCVFQLKHIVLVKPRTKFVCWTCVMQEVIFRNTPEYNYNARHQIYKIYIWLSIYLYIYIYIYIYTRNYEYIQNIYLSAIMEERF